MSGETYTRRTQEDITIEKVQNGGISWGGGWGTAPRPDVLDRMYVGMTVTMEQRGSFIVGWRTADGEWLMRKSDQDLDREHAEFVAKMEADRRERLVANRDSYTAREAALPEWIRSRVQTFHERGGDDFELNGWGYELCVAELAVAYVASNLTDDDAVMEISHREGTSGNQHDAAKSLARRHLAGASVGGTVSALAPLTGSAFYEVAP